MRKLMKRKVNLFGKEVSVFVIALFAIVLVSAALVPYLSKMVIGDIGVKSPMVAGISLGEDDWGGEHFPDADWDYVWSETISIPSIHGGETITLYTLSENLANVDITGFEEAIVTNLDGVTCDDFESVIVRVDSIYGDLGYGTPQQLIGTGGCQVIDDYHVQFGSLTPSLWSAEADVSEIVVTFKTNAVGDYTFTYQVIPEIP